MISYEKVSLAIGIPTINRIDLLEQYLSCYVTSYFPSTKIFIVDNGKQDTTRIEGYPNVTIIKNLEPRGVAASWNQLCKLIFKNHAYALILNDDVCLKRDLFEIKKFISEFDSDKTPNFFESMQGYCSFILPRLVYNTIGGFDEMFKGAYFEDKDYQRRLKLAGVNIMRTIQLNPAIYNESSSIAKDKSLNNNYQANWHYYMEKWGGTINGETFIRPFNI